MSLISPSGFVIKDLLLYLFCCYAIDKIVAIASLVCLVHHIGTKNFKLKNFLIDLVPTNSNIKLVVVYSAWK